VAEASRELLGHADLVLVGGPTHVHGMSRPATRKGAADAARKPGSGLVLDPGADGGVREWLEGLGQLSGAAAAFDTRMKGPAAFTGRASKGITHLLRRHGLTMVAAPESFLVTKENNLRPGEAARAKEWGASLAAKVAGALINSTIPGRGGQPLTKPRSTA
jgi:hypothetical protein